MNTDIRNTDTYTRILIHRLFFVYGSFNDIVSSSDYIAWNEKTIHERWIGNNVEWVLIYLNSLSRYLPGGKFTMPVNVIS
jgi:hypothetical protein